MLTRDGFASDRLPMDAGLERVASRASAAGMHTPAPIRLDSRALATQLAPVLAVVIHDVASPTWGACRQLRAALDSVDPALAKTWLVVPRYHGHPLGSHMIRALDEARALGDELVLHGWLHRDDGAPAGFWDALRRRRYTAGEGEFAALGAAEAARRLAAGRAWFAQQGWPLRGFVPPAWLIDAAGLAEVERAGFEHCSSLGALQVWRPRAAGERDDGGPRKSLHLPSQSVVYSTRSAWRRLASRAWNAGVARHQAERWLLRLELHPRDAQDAGIRRSWMQILERALRTREAVTLGEAARRLQAFDRAALDGDRRSRHGGDQASQRPIATIAPPVTTPASAPASTSLG